MFIVNRHNVQLSCFCWGTYDVKKLKTYTSLITAIVTLSVACRFLYVTANSLIWMDATVEGEHWFRWKPRGQLLDLDRCKGPTYWFEWMPRTNLLIWMDAEDQLFDLDGCLSRWGTFIWLYTTWQWKTLIWIDAPWLTPWFGRYLGPTSWFGWMLRGWGLDFGLMPGPTPWFGCPIAIRQC